MEEAEKPSRSWKRPCEWLWRRFHAGVRWHPPPNGPSTIKRWFAEKAKGDGWMKERMKFSPLEKIRGAALWTTLCGMDSWSLEVSRGQHRPRAVFGLVRNQMGCQAKETPCRTRRQRTHHSSDENATRWLKSLYYSAETRGLFTPIKKGCVYRSP